MKPRPSPISHALCFAARLGRTVTVTATVVTLGTIGGCAGDKPTQQAHYPAPGPTPAAPVATAQPTPQAPPEQPAAPSHGPTYTVDAMVGQVNGQPVYAGSTLEPIDDQLAALGRNQTRTEFRALANQLIAGRLRQIVIDALILGEAERDLSAQEQAGLANMLKVEREELIRRWGKGSIALAETSLLDETDRTLDQTLQDTRQRMLVQRYLQRKLFPKINVSRKHIERYYHDNPTKFNPPPNRTLRLIRVNTPETADQIESLLKPSADFATVASDQRNRYRSDQGGRMSEIAVGDEVFGAAVLNQAMLGLQPGQWSQRVEAMGGFWWIYVESIDQPPSRPLREVQLEIEELLRRQQFQALTSDYRRELFENGSYHPLDQMGEALVEIAVSRYAQPL